MLAYFMIRAISAAIALATAAALIIILGSVVTVGAALAIIHWSYLRITEERAR